MSRADAHAAIRAEMARRQWNKSDLIKAGPLSRKTVETILAGGWPQDRTLYKVEAALGMKPGHLEALAEGTADAAPMKPRGPTETTLSLEVSEVELEQSKMILLVAAGLPTARRHAIAMQLLEGIARELEPGQGG